MCELALPAIDVVHRLLIGSVRCERARLRCIAFIGERAGRGWKGRAPRDQMKMARLCEIPVMRRRFHLMACSRSEFGAPPARRKRRLKSLTSRSQPSPVTLSPDGIGADGRGASSSLPQRSCPAVQSKSARYSANRIGRHPLFEAIAAGRRRKACTSGWARSAVHPRSKRLSDRRQGRESCVFNRQRASPRFLARWVARTFLVTDGLNDGIPVPMCVSRLFSGFRFIFSLPLGVLGVLGG
jgi:hypothetical protein